MVSEIKRDYTNTEYNGIKLFDKTTPLLANPNRVVNQTTFVSRETYYITTSEDLVALQNLVNSGVSTSGVNFELTNDIDMSGVEFCGINNFTGVFNGNSYKRSNIKYRY